MHNLQKKSFKDCKLQKIVSRLYKIVKSHRPSDLAAPFLHQRCVYKTSNYACREESITPVCSCEIQLCQNQLDALETREHITTT